MGCEYCDSNVRFETKKDFEYCTIIINNQIVVSKKASWFDKLRNSIYRRIQKYKMLYSCTIKYCPMCGAELFVPTAERLDDDEQCKYIYVVHDDKNHQHNMDELYYEKYQIERKSPQIELNKHKNAPKLYNIKGEDE